MKLTDLSPRQKVVLLTNVFFCSDHIKAYCESLGLRREEFSVNNLTTLAGGDVVNALVEGLESGLACGVQKIIDQRAEAAEAVENWVKND